MTRLKQGLRIQTRVIGALMIRELATRFGRENIGFLWIVLEPLMFAVLVGLVWRFMKGPEEHGVSIISFIVTGYIPMVMFRNAVNRSIGLFTANGGLMYHRQIKIADFVFVRFLIEAIGHMVAYLAIGVVLVLLGEFPVPSDIGLVLAGWSIYGLFTLAICSVVAPLSEMSSVLEKIMPVVTYIMIPFSGTFTMTSWLVPSAQRVVLYAPPVHAMEMMRFGVFGFAIDPMYDVAYPVAVSLVVLMVGLSLCRKVRCTLVVE